MIVCTVWYLTEKHLIKVAIAYIVCRVITLVKVIFAIVLSFKFN